MDPPLKPPGLPSLVRLLLIEEQRPVIHQDWLPASQGRQWCLRREEPYDLAGFAHFSMCQGRIWPLNYLDLFFDWFMQTTRLNGFIDGVFFYFQGRCHVRNGYIIIQLRLDLL